MNKKTVLIIIGLLLGVACLCGGCSQRTTSHKQAERIQIIDMAGRTVSIPGKIDKVYASSANGSVFVYTLAPDKLVGWNSALRESEKKYIAAQYHNLPDLGRWKGTTHTGSIEELLRAKPDLILGVGDISAEFISDADNMQKQTGIPVLMVDGSLMNSSQSYRFVGKVLGAEDRAKELSAYCDKILQKLEQRIVQNTQGNKVRLYYAEGINGLETELSGTVNSEAIELAGAVNVAQINMGKGASRIQVSTEQVLAWDPELIIISSDGDSSHEVYNKILTDSSWNKISAVKNKQVYEIPCQPYDWVNRPPSIMRLLGVQWLGDVLAQDEDRQNIKEDMKEFFQLFFNYSIDQSEIEQVLSRSQVKK